MRQLTESLLMITQLILSIIHYAVANMPGAVPQTSTIALTNVTVPYALQIANKGVKKSLTENPALAAGLNTINGEVTYKAVANDLGYEYVHPMKILAKEEVNN